MTTDEKKLLQAKHRLEEAECVTIIGAKSEDTAADPGGSDFGEGLSEYYFLEPW